jgi:hypothetical protein
MNGADDAARLEEFFLELAENPGLYNNYLKSPVDTMRGYGGISEEAIGAVLRGDLVHINRLFAQKQDSGTRYLFGTIIRS